MSILRTYYPFALLCLFAMLFSLGCPNPAVDDDDDSYGEDDDAVDDDTGDDDTTPGNAYEQPERGWRIEMRRDAAKKHRDNRPHKGWRLKLKRNR